MILKKYKSYLRKLKTEVGYFNISMELESNLNFSQDKKGRGEKSKT